MSNKPRSTEVEETTMIVTPLRRRRSTGGLLLIGLMQVGAAFGIVTLSTSTATAADSTNYGIRPADAADHFQMELAPGAASERTAVVSNRSDKRTTFKIYPADALTTDQGGFALRSPDEPQSGIGRWASLPIETVTLAPGRQKEVTFRVTIPRDATPGDYAGGIIIEAPPRQGTPGEVGDETAVQLNVVERVGVRVYLKVSGTARADLSAGELTGTDTGDAVVFELPITNTGNVILEPAVTATLRARVGGNADVTFTKVEALLPGQTTTVRATWQDPPSLVWGRVNAVVKHEGGIERAHTDIRRVPWLPAAIIAVVSGLALWLVLRAISTVRAARRLLRQHAASPSASAEASVPAVDSSGTASAGSRARH
jgi:hypothetical protein